MSSAPNDYPEPSETIDYGSISWNSFWDAAKVTEYDYYAGDTVPRANQPADYVRLADQPLGAIALRVYMPEV